MRKFVLMVLLAVVSGSAMAEWDFLEIDEAISRMVGVKGIQTMSGSKEILLVDGITTSGGGKIVMLNILDGYVPNTVELGYKRPVSARIRWVMYPCGSPVAAVEHEWVRDANNDLFFDEPYKPPKSIPLTSDYAIRKAVLYACGDQSQKVGKIKHPTPEDAISLVCTGNNGGSDTYMISEKTNTVNGKKAEFSPYKILWRFGVPKEAFVAVFDRFSGQLDMGSDPSDGVLVHYKCVKQEKKLF